MHHCQGKREPGFEQHGQLVHAYISARVLSNDRRAGGTLLSVAGEMRHCSASHNNRQRFRRTARSSVKGYLFDSGRGRNVDSLRETAERRVEARGV